MILLARAEGDDGALVRSHSVGGSKAPLPQLHVLCPETHRGQPCKSYLRRREKKVLFVFAFHFLQLLILLSNARLMAAGTAGWSLAPESLTKKLKLFKPELAEVAAEMNIDLDTFLKFLGQAAADSIQDKRFITFGCSHCVIFIHLPTKSITLGFWQVRQKEFLFQPVRFAARGITPIAKQQVK